MDLLKKDSQEINNKIILECFENKKILVTGSSGLLGIQLLSLLKNSDVRFVCNALYKRTPTDYYKNLIYDDFRFSTYKNKDFLREDYFDYIFHFATYGQPNKFLDNQLKTIELNTTYLINLLKRLKFKGKFIYISSSEVYSGLTGSHKETDIGTTTPEHKRACYIEGKRCGETICKIFKDNGFDIKVIRLCLGYGVGVRIDDARAINQFIYKGLKTKNINLIDDGSVIRTYCYITDVLEMILKIMLFGKDLIYNVGGKDSYSIKEIVEKISSQLKISYTYNNLKPDKDAPNKVKLNINKYESEFGVKQFIDIDEGIKRLIDWYKYLLNQ